MPIREPETPILLIEPAHLDFGVIDPASGQYQPVSLTITNVGGGLLAGRINPQVTWVQVTPNSFRCAKGESSRHQVILTPRAPRYWKEDHYSSNFLLFITSNGGSGLVGGTYVLKPGAPPPKSGLVHLWLIVPTLLMVLLLSLIIQAIRSALPANSAATDEASLLYTQGAETVVARLTQLPSATSAYLTAEASSLFLVTTLIPSPTATAVTPIPTSTYTPWPRLEYPNPEQLIRDYYAAINARSYERAWAMLSKRFQQACCNIGGNRPFDVYTSWWNTIDRVEVISAYLQQWDANPAVVHVSLRLKTKKGETIEAFYVFYLIADAERKTLVIDVVQ